MTPGALETSAPVGRLIEQLQAMSSNIEQAIAAVAANCLPELENSLWLQEMLAARLSHRMQEVRGAAVPPAQRLALRAAILRLGSLNRSYDAVVKQGAQTSTLLRGMCSFYQSAAGSPSQSECGSLRYEI